MTDREKLVELLDIIIQPGQKTLGDIADHLIANGVTVQEWISVEDALPCMNKFVLVTDGSLVKEAYYNGRAEWICNGHDMEQGGVVITHWKHKPEPPKEEKDA